MADEDRVGGAAQNLAGKAKDAAGGALGDTKLQGEGKADQAAGTVRNAVGGAKDAAREWTDDMQGELSRLRGEVDRLLRERVSPAVADAAGAAGDYAQRAKDVAVRQGEQAAAVVKENPLLTVGLVAAAAFLLGRLTGGDRTHNGWR
jgi:uncharacterized protein YjbJ (UPF0337 family)